MPLNEADTRAKLIDPALRSRGWTEDLIRREESAGAIHIFDGYPRKQMRGRVDYTLRVKVNSAAQPVAVALIEAKSEDLPPTHGLEQAKLYAASQRLNVPFVYSTNGHLFVEYDSYSGLTTDPLALSHFPTPSDIRGRYEQKVGFSLADPAARPLLSPYSGGEAGRRYYQDAAIRAVFEKLARCDSESAPRRALLTLATGAGKTYIAVQILKRIADAGQLHRALFVCDRDELRSQALGALQNVFGADAASVSGSNPQKNARVLIATYQTLDVDSDEADASFLEANYPPDYFSHIIIDECHRSAWGKWSAVLTRNPNAAQIGLTATPRQLEVTEKNSEVLADLAISADNMRYFGEPVYEYDIAQGIEDGYLAACEIVRRNIFLDRSIDPEENTGIERDNLNSKRLVDSNTGEILSVAEARERYSAGSFEDKLLMPDRVQAMCEDLFSHLLATGGPEQKTIIFCARDSHADRVATELNNLYAAYCSRQGLKRAVPYAFKCTAANAGGEYLPDLRGNRRRHFIACTVDLLTTGVDVPCVRNVVFFKYVRSPIAFYQMVGRGTRLDPTTGKLMFRLYDYTNATRLFGKSFVMKGTSPREGTGEPGPEPERAIEVHGFEVHITDAGRYIITMVDGKAMPVTVEEYKERVATALVEQAPSLDAFRALWIAPDARQSMLAHLPEGARSAILLRSLESMDDFDLYDVLADLAYGMAARSRANRAEAFSYKNGNWLSAMPTPTASTVQAIASQFARSGTDALENPHIFSTPEVHTAGGLPALKALGKPADVLRETKERMFAA
ncbi:MAG TPA: DEAD/DEAH box helicase family protein [Chloroflexia bacterium]|jgi:type I restriction enzyme R subunit